MKHLKLALTLLVIVSLFSMCKKDSVNKNNGNTTNATYYFKGTLNGTVLNWQVSDQGDYVEGSSAATINDAGDISGGVTALISKASGFLPQFGIEFKTFHKTQNGDAATAFYSLVKTGAWTYSNTMERIIGDKSVVIYYTDASGKQYSSVGSQTGSSVNVVSVAQLAPALGNNGGDKIKVTFNCTLYPEDGSGGSLKITNGEATVFLEEMLDT